MVDTPAVVYHETSAWDGGDLLPLAARMDRDAAIAEFLRRWPLCDRAQAEIDVDLVWTIDSSFGRGQGGIVLAIDASKVDLEWYMHESETDGGWVAERIPAEAIIGPADDSAVRQKIDSLWAAVG